MRARRESGFTLIELLAVVGIMSVVTAVAIPYTTRTVGDIRLRGDARALHNMVALAKMRAAARFTRERLFVDFSTESFFLQYWDKTGSSWTTEGGATHLSSGVDFGFGELDTPPPNTQASIAQASECLDADGESIEGTACVVFNSRGIPIDEVGAPTGNTGFYLTDATGVYGVTLSATPLIRLWWSPASHAAWVHK